MTSKYAAGILDYITNTASNGRYTILKSRLWEGDLLRFRYKLEVH